MGTETAVAKPHTWYRNVHVSNLDTTHLRQHQVLIAFNSKEMIARNQLRNDCEDLEVRSSTGHVISTDVLSVWLDRSSCNQEETFLWIKIQQLNAGKSLSLRLVSGSGESKTIKSNNNPKDVFDIFDGLNSTNSILFQHSPNVPTIYSEGGLDVYATSPALSAVSVEKRKQNSAEQATTSAGGSESRRDKQVNKWANRATTCWRLQHCARMSA